MKGIIPLLLMFFFLSAMDGSSEKRNKDSRPNIQLKTDSTSVNQNDTLPKNSININGQLNSVSITNNDVLTKKMDSKPISAVNTVKINGNSNSVNIDQNNQEGNVTIKQNGNGNQVNVSQSKTKAIRQGE